ncbi:MAG: DUF1801 domain-containing protein [Pseudomonadota bacterium]
MDEVRAHIDAMADPRRRAEAETLLELFGRVSGYEAKLWSGRMIGFGRYDYTYESGHSGTSLATGYAMGARQISLYILPGYTAFPDIVARLGKHKHGKACFYATRLENIDLDVLGELIRAGLDDLATRWTIKPN